jgi:hypothetical protein
MTGKVFIPTQLAPLAGITATATALCIVDKCVVYNTGLSVVNAALHIAPVGAVIGLDTQIGNVSIAPGFTDYCSQLVGAWLGVGYRVVIVPSADAVLTVYSGVRE